MSQKWYLAIEWCFRTCASAAVASFLCLYSPTQTFFSYDGRHVIGLGYTTFICIIVKDATIGATINNGWASIFGGFVASFLCWTILLAIYSQYSPYSCLIILFFLSFTIQYVEFHPMGKKLALSIVALSLLQNRAPDVIEPWRFFFDISLGVSFALLGNIMPWPKRASALVEEMEVFVSEVYYYFMQVYFLLYLCYFIHEGNLKSCHRHHSFLDQY